ncbi:hypothetical protein CEXT_343941 [Caerostris extrusa]|uniref:Uncharacterized protein n=1 Tax=Caerostris extrusa TaxID=172846 RepID=A0AAV4XPN1_CAEEX|nr:hypothetical protein CEXT_343941 [Caerostris extrusa]
MLSELRVLKSFVVEERLHNMIIQEANITENNFKLCQILENKISDVQRVMWNFGKANWMEFSATLERQVKDILDKFPPGQAAMAFSSSSKTSPKQSIPSRRMLELQTLLER